MHFDLPVCPAGCLRVIDTALPLDQDLPETPQRWSPVGIPLENRSLVLLVNQNLLKGERL
jgi:isoamylase